MFTCSNLTKFSMFSTAQIQNIHHHEELETCLFQNFAVIFGLFLFSSEILLLVSILCQLIWTNLFSPILEAFHYSLCLYFVGDVSLETPNRIRTFLICAGRSLSTSTQLILNEI